MTELEDSIRTYADAVDQSVSSVGVDRADVLPQPAQPRSERRLVLVGVAAVLVLALGLGVWTTRPRNGEVSVASNQTGSVVPSTTVPSSPSEPVRATATDAGTTITLTVTPGKPFHAVAQVTNTTNQPVLWQSDGCDEPIAIAVVPPSANGQLGASSPTVASARDYLLERVRADKADFVDTSRPEADCSTERAVHTLAPGASLQSQGQWDPSSLSSALLGPTLTIQAQFSRISATEPPQSRPVSVRTTVPYQTSASSGLNASQALDALLGNNEFRAWQRVRTDAQIMDGAMTAQGATWEITLMTSNGGMTAVVNPVGVVSFRAQ